MIAAAEETRTVHRCPRCERRYYCEINCGEEKNPVLCARCDARERRVAEKRRAALAETAPA